MTISTGQRARGRKVYRNRAVYRNADMHPEIATDAELVARCVPLWRECAKRANSRYGGTAPGKSKGRSAALRCPDDVLREHGVTFARDRREWGAYEKAIRLAANVKPRQGRKNLARTGAGGV